MSLNHLIAPQTMPLDIEVKDIKAANLIEGYYNVIHSVVGGGTVSAFEAHYSRHGMWISIDINMTFDVFEAGPVPAAGMIIQFTLPTTDPTEGDIFISGLSKRAGGEALVLTNANMALSDTAITATILPMTSASLLQLSNTISMSFKYRLQ